MGKPGCIACLVIIAVSVGFAIAGYPLSLFVTVGALLWSFWQLGKDAEKSSREWEAKYARRLAIAPPGGDCWKRQFEAEGLAHLIAATEPHVKLALRIETVPFDGKLGGSRMGGSPDLPTDADWSGNFIAQLNLEEVAAVWPDSPLPKSGHLWFFQNGEETDDGSVYFTPVETALVRMDGEQISRGVRFIPFEDIPEMPEAPDAYDEIRTFINGHKLLGYADWVQGSLEEPGKRLLLQIVNDEELNFGWGDLGTGYFVIRDEDLQGGRFEAATLEIQFT